MKSYCGRRGEGRGGHKFFKIMEGAMQTVLKVRLFKERTTIMQYLHVTLSMQLYSDWMVYIIYPFVPLLWFRNGTLITGYIYNLFHVYIFFLSSFPASGEKLSFPFHKSTGPYNYFDSKARPHYFNGYMNAQYQVQYARFSQRWRYNMLPLP